MDELVTKESLACARCGYPIVDRSLAWHPSIHVTGPLAELELGPTARNIHGARAPVIASCAQSAPNPSIGPPVVAPPPRSSARTRAMCTSEPRRICP